MKLISGKKAALVFAIVAGAMVGVAALNGLRMVRDHRADQAREMLAELKDNVVRFHATCGAWPTSLAEVFAQACPNFSATTWKAAPLDPWGHPFVYTQSENHIRLISLGADGREGGDGEEQDIATIIEVRAQN